MYLEYFGLARLPFQITPDVSFYFDSQAHSRAMATIIYGLNKHEGFVVVTGEVGAGKTTLIEYLLATGRLAQLTAAKINTTQLEPDSLLTYIQYAFGFERTSSSKADALKSLGAFFERAQALRRRPRRTAHALELPGRGERCAADAARGTAGVPCASAESCL